MMHKAINTQLVYIIFAGIILFPGRLAAQENYQDLLNQLLKKYVTNGWVDYKGFKQDARLPKVIELMSAVNPDALKSDDEKLAFWINAYNIWTIKIICDNYPVKSINDLHTGGLIIGQVLGATVWDKKLVKINGKEMTLNNIEHDIIRKEFKEPRIHFALVCAAVSCPPLRSEAFEAARLDKQLHDQGVVFFTEKNKNSFDAGKKVAVLSKIMDWYESDFGKDDAAVLLYIANFLDKPVAAAIRQDVKNWDVKYSSYDWSLNEKK